MIAAAIIVVLLLHPRPRRRRRCRPRRPVSTGVGAQASPRSMQSSRVVLLRHASLRRHIGVKYRPAKDAPMPLRAALTGTALAATFLLAVVEPAVAQNVVPDIAFAGGGSERVVFTSPENPTAIL